MRILPMHLRILIARQPEYRCLNNALRRYCVTGLSICRCLTVDASPRRVVMVATSALPMAVHSMMFFLGMILLDAAGRFASPAWSRRYRRRRGGRALFRGAVGELGSAGAPFVVVDSGGGSTEIVLGEHEVVASYSADIGCVRLTERRLHSDPPTLQEVSTARRLVRERLEPALAHRAAELARPAGLAER